MVKFGTELDTLVIRKLNRPAGWSLALCHPPGRSRAGRGKRQPWLGKSAQPRLSAAFLTGCGPDMDCLHALIAPPHPAILEAATLMKVGRLPTGAPVNGQDATARRRLMSRGC
jgi:hypothetical protein